MTGRTLHSRAFLTDLQEVIKQQAPELLEQPVGKALSEAWMLCEGEATNDYDPRLRSALGMVAEILDVDVGPATAVAELPLSIPDSLDRIYRAGNIHSLAQYFVTQTKLLFNNSNVEAIYLGPVGSDSVLMAKLWNKKLLVTFSADYTLERMWFEFDYVAGPERSEIVFTKQDFTDRGLEFYTDFGRNSSHVSWIAFADYRLALGNRAQIPPWVPLADWR